MRLETDNAVIERGGIKSESTFSIKMDGHIAQLLSSSIYTNKPLAVIREYSCNAHDAHVMAGITDPIHIHLPTQLEPYFAVTDKGPGLSHEEMQELFTTYGSSNKRLTNTAIGGFGIGSKAGFAYTDSFTVTSHHAGIQRMYSCYKDEEGLFKLALLAELPTTSTGLVVNVPVKQQDINLFTSTAKTFFLHFTPRPLGIDHLDLTLPAADRIASVDVFKGNSYSSSYKVKMGNVVYELSREEFSNLITCAVPHQFLVHAEIGDLDIAASREAIQFSPRTIAQLKKVFAEFRSELDSRMGSIYNGCTNLYQKWLRYYENKPLIDEYNRIYNHVFNAPALPNNTDDPTLQYQLYADRYYAKSRWSAKGGNDWYNWNKGQTASWSAPSLDNVLIIQDRPLMHTNAVFMHHFDSQKINRILMVHQNTYDMLLKGYGEYPYQLFSQLYDDWKAHQKANRTPAAKRPKGVPSAAWLWTSTSIDRITDTSTMDLPNSWHVKFHNGKPIQEPLPHYALYTLLGISIDKPIYGFRQDDKYYNEAQDCRLHHEALFNQKYALVKDNFEAAYHMRLSGKVYNLWKYIPEIMPEYNESIVKMSDISGLNDYDLFALFNNTLPAHRERIAKMLDTSPVLKYIGSQYAPPPQSVIQLAREELKGMI